MLHFSDLQSENLIRNTIICAGGVTFIQGDFCTVSCTSFFSEYA